MSTQVLPPRPDVLVHEPTEVVSPIVEAPRRRRGWLIAATLAGFVVAGGIGAGYASTLDNETTTRTPVVVAPADPIAPVEPVAPPAPVGSLADQFRAETAAQGVTVAWSDNDQDIDQGINAWWRYARTDDTGSFIDDTMSSTEFARLSRIVRNTFNVSQSDATIILVVGTNLYHPEMTIEGASTSSVVTSV